MSKQTSTSLFRDTLDNLIEGYQLIDFEWRYVYVNGTVIRQSKYNSKEDLIGYTMMEKYPGIEQTEMFRLLEQCMKQRCSDSMINEFTFPDGSKGWFELRMRPVPQGIFILSLDITEQKRAEQDKKNYTQFLEEMIHMTSHKVRQPVCNISGFLNLLEKNKLSKKQIHEIISYLKRGVNDLDTFTKELSHRMYERTTQIN